MGFVVVTEHAETRQICRDADPVQSNKGTAARHESIADVIGPELKDCEVAFATSTPTWARW